MDRLQSVRHTNGGCSDLKSRTFASLDPLNSCNSLNSFPQRPSQNYCQYDPDFLICSLKNKGRLVLRPLARIRDSCCKQWTTFLHSYNTGS
jgi:hypothetical protein